MMKYVLAVVVTAVVVGGVTYYAANQSRLTSEKALNDQIGTLNAEIEALKANDDTPAKEETPTALTNDQIYQEVATQFKLTRSDITYFRIFGQDRVQYSVRGSNIFAYKIDDTWKMAGPDSAQAVVNCSTLTSVPEKYRPPCEDSNGKVIYIDGSRASTNYPPSQMFSYIGQ